MEKRPSSVLAALIALLMIPAASLGALEVGTSFQLGNIGFTPDRASTDLSYSGLNLFWGGSLYLSHDISDSFSIETGFSRDPILRNDAYALLHYTTDYLTLGVGAFLGLFNTDAPLLKSGLTITARLGIPGVLFVSARTDTSLGGQVQLAGDYVVEATELSIGFYVKNAIFSVDITSRDFTLSLGAAQVVDDLTRYGINVTIFRKNAPMRILLSTSYQTVSKEFMDGVTNPAAVLNSVILGAGLDVQLFMRFSLYADFRTAVYSWGTGLLVTTPGLGYETFLWEGSAGFRINLDPDAGVN